MPDQLQLRGGTTTEHNSFTGAAREVTVDTTKKTLVVHDGSQAGGTPLMKESGATAASSVQIGTGGVERFKITSSEIVFNETSTDTDFRIEGNGEANLFKVDAGTDLIGIGTSSPSTRLHVEGSQDSLLFLKSTDAGSGLAAADNSGSSIIQNIGGSFRVLTGGDPNVVGTASTEKFRITGSGNVGIGTASPSFSTFGSNAGGIEISDVGSGANALLIQSSSNEFFIANTSTANYIFGADNVPLIFSTNGSEAIRVKSNLNVGIGTTNPSSKLHVSSSESVALFDGNPSTSNVYVDINAAANRRGVIRFQSAGTNKWSIGRGDSDEFSENNFHISTGSSGGNAAKLVVTSAGNVGIGTTSPETLLHAKINTFSDDINKVALTLSNNQSSGVHQYFQNASTGTGVSNGARIGLGNTDNFLIQHFEAKDIQISTNGTERMRIDSSGKVGIGTSSPEETLDLGNNVQMNLKIGGRGYIGQAYSTAATILGHSVKAKTTGTTSGGMIVTETNSGGGAPSALRMQSGTIEFHTAASGTADADFNSNERMRIDSSGHLLHGCTSSPSSSTKGSAFKFDQNQGQVAIATNTTSQAVLIDLINPNGSVGDIRTSGSGIIINGTSDYRLKENAVAISDGITRLKTLKPYRFNFKADPTTTLDGFFAHEVTAVPEAVTGIKDEIASEDNNLRRIKKGDPIYQGIDQSKLVPLLVAAVKELIGKVETLEAA